ncbi:hypothetical protein R9C00_25825 [Flammeovirgaceae bacterium SG7u.111]|nr:hypothetical protein [Flammeovirgaceae bacterium SG7u.132]WPO35117.1 hypothetical protein R9C00_25825 [Flammeovirgaceae bacterium SG7u.111]
MIQHILKVRLAQLGRYMAELGWIRSVLGAGLLVFLWLMLLKKAIFFVELSAILLGVSLASITYLHLYRPDKAFLNSFGQSTKWVFWAEYLLLSFPILLIASLTAYWWAAIIYVVIVGLLSLLKWTPRQLKTFTLPLRIIPAEAFEWKSGLRLGISHLVSIYLFVIILMPSPYFFPLLLLGGCLVCTNFYFECEPLIMLRATEVSSGKFLFHKIGMAFKLYLLLFSIPTVVYIAMHSEFWFLPLYGAFVGCFLLALAILMKYSLYQPGLRLGFNSMMIGFSVVSFVIPFLAPVPIFLLIRYARKASKNLNLYLYD